MTFLMWLFCNGAIVRENGDIFIYYVSSDLQGEGAIYMIVDFNHKALEALINKKWMVNYRYIWSQYCPTQSETSFMHYTAWELFPLIFFIIFPKIIMWVFKSYV
jgi:hypothetical protein